MSRPSRTVLDVDRDLLGQVKTILGVSTITAAINEALRRVVAQDALERIVGRLSEAGDEEYELMLHVRDTAW